MGRRPRLARLQGNASPGKARTLAPVRPNEGVTATYRRRMVALIDEMHASVLHWIKAAWRADPPELAQDISPAAALAAVIKRLTRQWSARFADAAPRLARWFALAASQRSDAALARILRDAGLTVQFKLTAAQNDILRSAITENVGLITNLCQQHLREIEGLVMRSVQTGGDLHALARQIQHRYGMTKRRAVFIARDQHNKVVAATTRARQLELGVTKAVWLHSAGGHKPRPEHVAFSGQTYDVARGAWLEGVWTWPGREPNCRCVSKIVLDVL